VQRSMTSSASKDSRWKKEWSFQDIELRRLVPLWRYGLWLAMLFVVSALWTQNRIVVNELHDDLGRTMYDIREANHRQAQLQLELDLHQSMEHLNAEAIERGYGPVVMHSIPGVTLP